MADLQPAGLDDCQHRLFTPSGAGGAGAGDPHLPREGRRTRSGWGWGALRMVVFIYVIMLINRPVLKVTEPSTSVRAGDPRGRQHQHDGPGPEPRRHAQSRSGVSISPAAAAGRRTFHSSDHRHPLPAPAPTRPHPARRGHHLLPARTRCASAARDTHHIRLYRFSKDAQAVATISGPPGDAKLRKEKDERSAAAAPTQGRRVRWPRSRRRQRHAVVPSLLTVLDDLQCHGSPGGCPDRCPRDARAPPPGVM